MAAQEQIEQRPQPILGLVAVGPEINVPPRAWRIAHNVRFEAGSVKNALGWTKFCGPGANDDTPVLLIMPQSDSEGLERVVVATGRKFYQLLATGQLMPLEGGPFNADLNNRWQQDSFANTIYAAQLNDYIQKIEPGANIAEPIGGGYVLSRGTITPSAGGSGYEVGDILTLPGAVGDVGATVSVDTVDGTGKILQVSWVSQGHYAAQPAGTINATGGKGEDCAFDATGIFVTWAPKARFLTQFEGHLLVGSVVDVLADYQAIAGSGLAGVGAGLEDWDYGNTLSDADLRDVPEGGGPIMGLLRNGSYVLIQKQTTSLLLSYIQQPLVYAQRELPQKVGQFTPYAAADCSEMGIVFVSRNGLFRMDAGGNVTNIGERVSRAWLADLIYGDRERTYAVGIKERREFVLAYSSMAAAAGPFGRAMVWDWFNDAYSTRDWPFTALGVAHVPRATAGQIKTPWQDLKMPWVQDSDIIVWAGDVDGNVHVYGRPDLSDGANPMVAMLQSGRSDHGDDSKVKMLRRVFVKVLNISGDPLYLDVGQSDTPEGDLVWTDKVPIMGSGWVEIQAVGRYLSYRFTKTGGTFELAAYAPAFVFMGAW